MRNTLLTFVAMAGMLFGHHGWAEFDEKAEVTYEGTVTDFHFVNPHCVLEFDVKDEKGQVRKWQGEFSNPGQLRRGGWTPTSLKAGDKVAITGHPARTNTPAIHLTKVRFSDGRELKVGYDSQ